MNSDLLAPIRIRRDPAGALVDIIILRTPDARIGGWVIDSLIEHGAADEKSMEGEIDITRGWKGE